MISSGEFFPLTCSRRVSRAMYESIVEYRVAASCCKRCTGLPGAAAGSAAGVVATTGGVGTSCLTTVRTVDPPQALTAPAPSDKTSMAHLAAPRGMSALTMGALSPRRPR